MLQRSEVEVDIKSHEQKQIPQRDVLSAERPAYNKSLVPETPITKNEVLCFCSWNYRAGDDDFESVVVPLLHDNTADLSYAGIGIN